MLGRILRRILVLSVLCMVAYLLYREFGTVPAAPSQETIVNIDPAIGAPARRSPVP